MLKAPAVSGKFVCLFFLAYFLAGLAIVGDYGVHWDEFNNQAFGETGFKRALSLFSGLSAADVKRGPAGLHSLIHGPSVEIALEAAKRILRLHDSRDIILMRHFLTFLLFYLGVIFFFKLCAHVFRSRAMGLAGALFLILHPRIFSHAFYNSVDIPFLSFYVISAYTLVRYLESPTVRRALIHAVVCALLATVRVAGGVMIPVTGAFVLGSFFSSGRAKRDGSRTLKYFSVYVLFSVCFIYAFWPMLWNNPAGTIYASFKAALYNSASVAEYRPLPPWYYNFRWIFMTTPPVYSAFFLYGLAVTPRSFGKRPPRGGLSKRDLSLALILFFVPVGLPILCRSRLFDEWRHHYFIYPVFILITLHGLGTLLTSFKPAALNIRDKVLRASLVLLLLGQEACVVYFIVRCHPHEHVYANFLAGKDLRWAKEELSLDYWGLSYRSALEYLLKNVKEKTIRVYVFNFPGVLNVAILRPSERERLVYVDAPEKADYFLTDFRCRNRRVPYREGVYPCQNEVYALRSRGVCYMAVYKLNNKP